MKAAPLIVHLPDARGVELSQYGSGNLKLGFGVYTYSRLPGHPAEGELSVGGTCPGSTAECEAICYAKRVRGIVRSVIWTRNGSDVVPPIPVDCQVLRIHVSGDFDSVAYINNWEARLVERPDVTAWAYTRSWRVSELLPALCRLQRLPNLQLFASMDPSTQDVPPAGWRRAWIYRDKPNPHRLDDGDHGAWPVETRIIRGTMRHGLIDGDIAVWNSLFDGELFRTLDGESAYVCPEETGKKANCLECGYCFRGKKHDVVFLEHGGK